MSYTKRTTGNINLTAIGGGAVNLTGDVIVEGNLTTTGNLLVIESTELQITDNLITLNSNITSGSPIAGNSGVEILRGNSAAAVIQWNEDVSKWQLYNGSVLSNIASTTGGTGFLEYVQDDVLPNLGGNLNTNSFSILSTATNGNISLLSNGNVNLTANVTSNVFAIVAKGAIKMPELTFESPAPVGSNVTVFAKNISTSYGTTLTGGGGTGLYFVNTTMAANVSDELVSKTKAIFYGLIF